MTANVYFSSSIHSMANCGPFQLFATLSGGSGGYMYVFSKVTYSNLASYTLSSNYYWLTDSLTGDDTYLYWDKTYFYTFIMAGFRNLNTGASDYSHVNTFRITVQSCATRDPTNYWCQACAPDNTVFLRNSRSPYCEPIEDLPLGFGFNKTGGQPGIIDSCLDINCDRCIMTIAYCEICKSGFYVHAGRCFNNSEILPFWSGPFLNYSSLTGMTYNHYKLSNCSDGNCLSCPDDYRNCTKCATYTAIYISPSTLLQSCISLSSANSGYGLNITSGLYEPCVDPYCTRCRYDINYCEGCGYFSPDYYASYQGVCVLKYNLPSGYGSYTYTTNVYQGRQCNQALCGNCSSSYSTCYGCKVNPANQTYLYAGSCFYPDELYTSYSRGANLVTLTGVACQDSRCADCRYDYTNCRRCSSSYTYYLYNGACVAPGSLPAGFGYDATDMTAKPCSAAYCAECVGSGYTYCTKCQTGLSWPRYAYGGRCIISSALPSLVGGVIGQGTTASCTDSYCQYCRDNNAVCTECQTGTNRYLYNGVCTHFSSLPDGYGAKSTGYVAVPCKDTHCQQCQSNYLTCTLCLTESPQYFLYSGECYASSTLPDFYGGNAATKQATSCATYCQKCQADYTVCTKCDPAYTKYLYSGSCLSAGSLPNGWGAGPNNVALPCNDTNCRSCFNDYLTCTQCQNTPTMWYFHAPNSSCIQPSQMPVGYGARVVSGYGQSSPCTVSGCSICQGDYSICGGCAMNTPRYWIYNSVCTLEPNLPDGIGANAATNGTQACSDTNCKNCRANFSYCQECIVLSPPRYLYTGNGTCLLPSELPAGYGANTATKIATACSTVNCSNCQVNYTTCVGCNTTGAYPSFLLNNICYLNFEIPLNYGANFVSYTGVPCASNRCLNCSLNFSNCYQCQFQSSNLYLHYTTAINFCYLDGEIPAGYGGDSASMITRTCLDTRCAICNFDYRVCTQCNAVLTPVVYLHNGTCKEAPDIPNPYGANLATRVSTKCSDPACIQCKLNYSFCEACSTSAPETYLHPIQGTCYAKEDSPDGWGPNKQNYELTPCNDTNCNICKFNYLDCTVCKKTPEQFYVYMSKCIKISQLPLSVGCNNETYYAVPCLSIGCKYCTNNYTECTQCIDPPAKPSISNPKYYLIEKYCDTCNTLPLKVIDTVCNRLCDKPSCLINLKKTQFVQSKKELRAYFSQPVFLNKSNEVVLRVNAPDSNIVRDLDPTEYNIQILSDVMLITLSIKDPEVRGSIIFDRANFERNPIRGSGTLAFYDYPITWENVYVLTSTAQKSLSGASSTTMTTTSSAKAIANLLVITRSSNIAKIPDMMVANMIYLKFMNGETYLYPSIVYDFFESSGLPFLSLENPFEYMKDANCLVAPKMYDANLDCNILVNYGTDVLFLYGTLAINILLSIIHFGLYGAKLRLYKKHHDEVSTKKMENSMGFKISNFINESYGVKMTLIKLDGTIVEVMFNSFLTLSSQGITNMNYFFGYMVATSLVVYYIWSLYFYIRLLVKIAPGLEKIRQMEAEREALRPAVYKPKALEHYIDFSRVPYGIVGYQIADYRANIPMIFMLAPLVWFARCIGIITFLIGGTNMKSGQYYVYILIEGAYLYYLVKSKVKASQFENWLSFFNEGSQIVYLVLQLVSYYSSDVDFKQKQIGLGQAAILGLIMLINIGYTFAIFFWSCLIEPILVCCKKRKAPARERLPENELEGKKKDEDMEGDKDKKKEPPKKIVVSTFRHLMKSPVNKPDRPADPESGNLI
jgi:hypothetical protein